MQKITAKDICEMAKGGIEIGVRQGRCYQKINGSWQVILEGELPIMIRRMYPIEKRTEISTSAIKEAIERLIQDPDLQLYFTEEDKEHYINIKNGVFNTQIGALETHTQNLNFGYVLDISYIPLKNRNMQVFNKFVNSTFPEETDRKKKLLLQILGYCLSDYCKAKTGFFLVGESNSGKSVILEFLQSIFSKQAVTAIPLYRLENRFNLAKLADARVNICTELSEKSFQVADIYKMLTSNEIVTAEHKGKKPFEFKIKCKSINAGNMFPNIENLEGMDALLNRMTILLFPVSIPKEQQDLHLLEKLYEEKDAIFSSAIDELVILQKQNFIFIEPNDTKKLKKQMKTASRVFEDFLSDCCIKEENSQEHFVILYKAFQEYCEDNLLEVKLSKTQFSQKFARISGIQRKKFRIHGGKPLYGVIGIRLKKIEEYIMQDSE